MIDKNNKQRLKRIAKQIFSIEQDINNEARSVKEGMTKISELSKGLDFEELLWIDDYICKTYGVES